MELIAARIKEQKTGVKMNITNACIVAQFVLDCMLRDSSSSILSCNLDCGFLSCSSYVV